MKIRKNKKSIRKRKKRRRRTSHLRVTLKPPPKDSDAFQPKSSTPLGFPLTGLPFIWSPRGPFPSLPPLVWLFIFGEPRPFKGSCRSPWPDSCSPSAALGWRSCPSCWFLHPAKHPSHLPFPRGLSLSFLSLFFMRGSCLRPAELFFFPCLICCLLVTVTMLSFLSSCCPHVIEYVRWRWIFRHII